MQTHYQHWSHRVKIASITVLLLPSIALAQVEIRSTSNAANNAASNTASNAASTLRAIDLGAVPTSTPTSPTSSALPTPGPAATVAPSVVTSQPGGVPALTAMPTAAVNTVKVVSPPLMASPRLPAKTLARTGARTPSRTLPRRAADAASAEDNASAGSIERVTYRQLPLLVALRAGRERILRFPHPVTMSVPDELNASMKQLDIIERAIYLTASAAFPRTRVIVHDLVTGQLLPLDLQASSVAAVSDVIEIATSTDAEVAAGSTAAGPGAVRRSGAGDGYGDDSAQAAPVDMVALTRYAAINLYAPQRLVTPVAGVRQVSVASRPVKNLYRGEAIEATPIGAWRGQDLYVTAVKLVNRSRTPVNLDMTQLRGQWLAATPQHGTLAAAGDERDTTAVYLVSQRAFDESR